jgi:hypothetical protein
MVSVFTSSAVVRGFELSRVKPDYTIGICCFSSKHAALGSKNKDWLARNQDDVSEWRDMSTCEKVFFFSKLALLKIQLSE